MAKKKKGEEAVRPGFQVYHDLFESVMELSDAEAGRVYKASFIHSILLLPSEKRPIFSDEISEMLVLPEFTGATKMYFLQAKRQIENGNTGYLSMCATNTENGQYGAYKDRVTRRGEIPMDKDLWVEKGKPKE